MKKLLILILFGLLMFVSYRYSAVVNRFYLKNYYEIMYSEDELVKKAWTLYDNGEYKKLESFIEPLLNFYLWNNDLKRVAGLNYIKLGNTVKGAELFASTFENGGGDSGDLMKVLRILFQSGNYGEITFFYDKKLLRDNVNCAFYYGASLYHLDRYREAYESLTYARQNGFIGDEIDYYTGITLEKLDRLSDAAAMLRSAYDANRYNRDVQVALVRVYRKLGDYEMAEILIRKQ